MKQRYPKILPGLARKAGITNDRAEAMWIEALRDATRECAVIESSEYWKAAVDNFLKRIAAESLARRNAPFGWGSLIRLPARQWLYGVTTAEALFAIGLRAARGFQHRPCH